MFHMKRIFRHQNLSKINALTLRDCTTATPKPEGWYQAKPYESIPGYKPLPVIGNSWRYFFGDLKAKNVVKLHQTLNGKFGDIVVLRKQSPLPEMVILYEPDDIEMMFRMKIKHVHQKILKISASTLCSTVSPKPEGWDQAKPFDSIPGHKPLPIIGNSWRFLFNDLESTSILKMHKTLNEKFGDIVAFRKQKPLPDMIMLYKPEDIEMLLRNEGAHPIRDGFVSIDHYRKVVRKDIFEGSPGLLVSQGEDWHKFRSKVNPILLQPRIAKNYIRPLDQVSSDFIRNMKALSKKHPLGELPDFLHEINKWSFESIGVIALDRRLGCLEEHPNAEAQKMVLYMVEVFKMMGVLDFTPIGHLYRILNFPYWRKYVEYQDYFTNITLKYLDETEKKIKASEVYNELSDHEKSAFEKLLKVDKKVAMVMTLDMLSAGIDTTGKATGAALYYLARYPEKQEELRKEVLAVMPSPNTPITNEILNQIPYVKAVIKEVGRLSPVVPGHMRKTTKDVVIRGYQIPQGAIMIVPTVYLSLSEEHYPRPKEFIPERWLKSTVGELSYKNTSPFVTLPFGFGPRSCVGRRFANLEMEIFLAKVVRNFTLTWNHKDMKFGQDFLYGIKDPLNIRVTEIKT